MAHLLRDPLLHLALCGAAVLQRRIQGPTHSALLDEFPGPEAPQLAVDLSDMLRQVQPYSLLLQPPVQQHQPLRRGQIHADDAAGIHDHRLDTGLHAVLHILLEPVDVGEEQPTAEPVQDHSLQRMRLTHAPQRVKARLPGDDPQQLPAGLGGPPDHVHEGQQHADDHPIDGPQHQHTQKGRQKNGQLLPIRPQQPVGHVELHRPQQGRNNDGRQHRHRQQPDQPAAPQQHRRHPRCRHQ